MRRSKLRWLFFGRVLRILSLFLAALSGGLAALGWIAVALLRGAEALHLIRPTLVGNRRMARSSGARLITSRHIFLSEKS